MATHEEHGLSSRERLLGAGKLLFSRNGYEQTSTAAIARVSGSSESQLIRYFAGKAGLLEAIFDESWAVLHEEIDRQIAASEHGRDAILRILSLMITTFSRDHDLAFLFLFEGRRTRGPAHEIVLSKGFIHFLELLTTAIERGQQDGSFRNDLPANVVAAAVLGTSEGMMRERVITHRLGKGEPFDDQQMLATFAAMLAGLAG